MTYFRLLACWEKDVNIYQQIQKSDLLSVNLEIWQASLSCLQIWKSFFLLSFLEDFQLTLVGWFAPSDAPIYFSLTTSKNNKYLMTYDHIVFGW